MNSALIEKLTLLAGMSFDKPQAMSTISLRLRKRQDLVQAILLETSFLPQTTKISERVHCVLNKISSSLGCEQCGIKVKFANGHYRRFCSQKCSANAESTRLKCIQTTLTQYGCQNVFQNDNVKSKIKSTNVMRHGVANTWELAKHGRFSRVSEDLFDHITPRLTRDYVVRYGVDEHKVITPLGAFKLDFYAVCENTQRAIEFFGDYWHANPKLFDATDTIKGKMVQSIWDRDSERLQAIRNTGIDVLVVWETDFKENPEDVLDLCIAFIEGY